MGKLIEQEIFDCMRTNLASAVDSCEKLAVSPLKGPIYEKLRSSLKLIEGCCRQASAWREDTRWLNAGLMMGEAHKRAGDWLRGFKNDEGETVKLAQRHSYQCFMKLAENLRNYAALTEQIRTKRVNRVGMILPAPLPAPHRDTRQHRVMLPTTPGGIIIPEGARLH